MNFLKSRKSEQRKIPEKEKLVHVGVFTKHSEYYDKFYKSFDIKVPPKTIKKIQKQLVKLPAIRLETFKNFFNVPSTKEYIHMKYNKLNFYHHSINTPEGSIIYSTYLRDDENNDIRFSDIKIKATEYLHMNKEEINNLWPRGIYGFSYQLYFIPKKKLQDKDFENNVLENISSIITQNEKNDRWRFVDSEDVPDSEKIKPLEISVAKQRYDLNTETFDSDDSFKSKIETEFRKNLSLINKIKKKYTQILENEKIKKIIEEIKKEKKEVIDRNTNLVDSITDMLDIKGLCKTVKSIEESYGNIEPYYYDKNLLKYISERGIQEEVINLSSSNEYDKNLAKYFDKISTHLKHINKEIPEIHTRIIKYKKQREEYKKKLHTIIMGLNEQIGV